jgi:hypothetical protein
MGKNLGKKHTDETRAKLSAVMTGKKWLRANIK